MKGRKKPYNFRVGKVMQQNRENTSLRMLNGRQQNERYTLGYLRYILKWWMWGSPSPCMMRSVLLDMEGEIPISGPMPTPVSIARKYLPKMFLTAARYEDTWSGLFGSDEGVVVVVLGVVFFMRLGSPRRQSRP